MNILEQQYDYFGQAWTHYRLPRMTGRTDIKSNKNVYDYTFHQSDMISSFVF